MATRMKSKIQPSVLKLNFDVSVEGSDEYSHIDLSQVASIVNRRFYRQGLQWAVSSIKIQTKGSTVVGPAPADPEIRINKLPHSWVMSNAWEKTFRAWKRQQDESLDDGDNQSVRAKFNDFKIFMDEFHHSDGFTRNLLPVDSQGNVAAPGEWEASQIVIPNFGAPGVNYEPYFTAVGPKLGGAGGYYSLIDLYANSRSTPQSPDPAVPADVLSTDNILNLMFDVGDNNTDVLANVVGKNDELPYEQDDYPGGDVQLPGLEIHDRAIITTTTVGGTSYLDGGMFPCGLMQFNWRNFNASEVEPVQLYLEVTLVPGSHRGYLCEPMTEM